MQGRQMEKINCSEKEIAHAYAIPLRTLKRLRKEQKIGKDICFTAPHNHQVIYNIANFEVWFKENKQTAIWTLNKQMKAVVQSLKDNGWWPDKRKKNGGDKWFKAQQTFKLNKHAAELESKGYAEHYQKPNKVDVALADVFEEEHKQ